MDNKNTLYTNVSVKELDNSEVEISAEIPVEVVEKYKDTALKSLQDKTELPGFRKGHVPEKMLVERLGETAILYEAVELVLPDVYPAIVLEEKLDVVGRPEISITKIAPGNPVAFTAKTAVMPQVTLPDYKSIAKKILKENPDNVVVEDKEVDEVINQIRKNKAMITKQNLGQGVDPQMEIKEEDLPEFLDEDAAKLGDFKTVSEFKEKLIENMKVDKERRQKEERRVKIAEGVIEKATVPLPEIFVESELDKIIGEMKGHIEQTGLSYQEYLKRIEKTEEDIREEARSDAEKRAKLQLILNAIAEKEELVGDPEKIDAEVKHILEHYKDADENRVRTYVESLFRNERVYELLEGALDS